MTREELIGRVVQVISTVPNTSLAAELIVALVSQENGRRGGRPAKATGLQTGSETATFTGNISGSDPDPDPEIREEKNISSEPSSPVVSTLPLAGGSEFLVSEAAVMGYEELYPMTNPHLELRKMAKWFDNNPSRRPRSASGAKRFVTSWLSRNQKEAELRNSQKPPKSIYRDLD